MTRDLATCTVGGGGQQSPPLTLGARHSATISVLAPGTQSVITCHFVKKIGLVSVNFAILVQNSQMHIKVFLQIPLGTENLLARTRIMTLPIIAPDQKCLISTRLT